MFARRLTYSQIEWNANGKIKSIERTASSTKSDLEFRYDAMGNRICKIVKPRNGAGILDQDEWTYTYYMRDASGNVIAVYDREFTTPSGTYNDILSIKENHLYGSSRVGIRAVSETQVSTRYTYVSTNSDGTFNGTFGSRNATAASTTNFNHELGKKAYEMSNHLGNVLTTVSDARNPVNSGGTITTFTAVVKSASDYYAFGSPLPGRNFNSSESRYGFGGKEKDDEMHGNSGDSYNYGARIYDARLGRFASVDPLAALLTEFSPYSFAGNNPIQYEDFNGMVGGDPKTKRLLLSSSNNLKQSHTNTFYAAAKHLEDEYKANPPGSPSR